MTEYIFLAILVLFSVATFWLNIKRNAWDVLFFNSTVAILAIFMVGILASDTNTWKIIVVVLGVIATGEKIVGTFIKSGDE